jgi:hypothetical protein
MVNCARANLPTNFAQVQAGARAQITAWRNAGRNVVEVPWVYDPAKARLPHLCNAYVTVQKDGERTDYFYHNKILRIPGGTQAKLTMAWDAHMKERHPGSYFPVPAGCILLPANPEMHQQQVDAFVQMYAGQKPEIVQLEWFYEAATPAEEAAAQAANDTPAFYCEMVGQGAREWYGTPVQVADKDWKWEDYTGAWRRYARTTLKLDPNLFIGACEPGTMKTQTRARAVRKEGFSGQGWTKLHDVDWKYVP